MAKHHERKRINGLLKELSPALLRDKSNQACRLLCENDEFKKASVVMLFLSLPDELDTSHVFLAAFQSDKTVVVPRVDWKSHQMDAVMIDHMDCEMVTDPNGLRYPEHGQPMPIDQIDLVIVPGIAYDDQGNRLGRGGGFYDRFLAHKQFQGKTCGLALEEQIIEKVPVMDHDVRVNMIVTDQRILRFDPSSQNKQGGC